MRVSTLARILRDAAFVLRNNGEPTSDPSGSQFICDVLITCRAVRGSAEARARAKDYLRRLGMGVGVYVFGPSGYDWEFTLEQQHQRMAWLFFAADLAEELGADFVREVLES